MGIKADNLHHVSAAVREIEKIEEQTNFAASRDWFKAHIDHTQISSWFDAEEKVALRVVILGCMWRRIDLQVQRCAALGVQIDGYADKAAWIKSKLEMVPEPKSDEEEE